MVLHHGGPGDGVWGVGCGGLGGVLWGCRVCYTRRVFQGSGSRV